MEKTSQTDFVTISQYSLPVSKFLKKKYSIHIPTIIVAVFSLLDLWFHVLIYIDLSVLQAICDVSLAQISDVDKAVAAAKEAFEEGEWGKMNPRDRGRLIYKSVHLFILILILVIWAQL